MKKILFSISAFFLCVSLSGQNQQRVSLLFAGDIMQHERQLTNACDEKTGEYDYSPSYKTVKEDVESADIAFANLETPISYEPYSGYPQFCAPVAFASAVKDAGFDVLVTSNNHSCDRYSRGILRTLDVLDSLGFRHTGMFRDSLERAEKYPLMFEKNGFKFALLNYTYDTNGIVCKEPAVVNLIDKGQIAKDIQAAKNKGAEIIIAFMHWGEEYKLTYHPIQKEYADFLIENGVHLVIGSHPHVVQAIEKRYGEDEKINNVVVYSLGNYLSGQRTIDTEGGATVKITLYKDENGITIEEANYALVWVNKKQLKNGKTEFRLLPVARYDKGRRELGKEQHERMMQFAKNAREMYEKQNKGVSEYKY